MAAYSAVVCLGQLLRQLLDSDEFSPFPKSELESFYNNIRSLQYSVQGIFPAPRSEREAANILQIEIRETIYQAQDAVENFITGKGASFSLQEIAEKIDPITAKAEKLADSSWTERRRRMLDDTPPSPRSSLISTSTTRVVGQEREKELLMQELVNDDKLKVLPIVGMAGIGKTTLARSIYDNPKVKDSFLIRGWVTVSQDDHVGDIVARLLNSIETRTQKAGERVYEGSTVAQLRVHLHRSLYYNKYLVVIDDMWELSVWDRLRNLFPDTKNGSRIIVTTRISDIARNVGSSSFNHEIQALNDENSWILLCEKAFGETQCPPHLEKIGWEIAKNCGGLPLALTVIGGLLSRGSQTEEYWRSIAEDTNGATAKIEDGYLEILYWSYYHLPGDLRGCFLYLAAFPEDSDIPLSKLTKLWLAEGFLDPSPQHTLEKVAEELLEDLCQRNLVTVRKISSDGRIKTCGLHDSMRDLAVRECRKEKFFHSRNKYAQQLEEDVQNQRRVSVHRNILMCLEQVYSSTRSITNARSLLYVGPHHHHPLPCCLTFDLLRVLDAFTVYFIDFPHEFLQLIHLRYLAFTYNDDLSPNISQLQKLQVLMVRREPRIIFVGVSFLPDEIWEMPELRHLWFTETDFPAPPPNNKAFSNLQSLTNINAASCTREVLKSMPNLKKLGTWVEAPGVVGLYLDELEQLEAFKFTVLNPTPNKQVEFQPALFFPPTLRKLSLSGCGLPWEDMEVIAQCCPSLEVLKLRELAFHGEEWRLSYKFETLKFLLIEYLNFKVWVADESHFPSLERLFIRHCYKLEGIPSDFGFIGVLNLIELVDCSPKVVESAEVIMHEQEDFDKEGFQVRIYCSYE